MVLLLLGVGGCRRAPDPIRNVSGCLDGRILESDFEGWKSEFDGFGCNSVATLGDAKGFRLRPQIATKTEETHAGLVLGPQAGNALDLSCRVVTLAQLRQGSPPNTHEVGWLVWHYRDNEHFYYLMVKPNGWELGKRDPAYPGGQRFLATGDHPNAAIGDPRDLRVVQEGPRIDVFIDNDQVTTFEDKERPYINGQIALYSEDADAFFTDVTLK